MNSDFYEVFEYIEKNHHRVYIATMTGICVGSQGKVRDFFTANPVVTLLRGPIFGPLWAPR